MPALDKNNFPWIGPSPACQPFPSRWYAERAKTHPYFEIDNGDLPDLIRFVMISKEWRNTRRGRKNAPRSSLRHFSRVRTVKCDSVPTHLRKKRRLIVKSQLRYSDLVIEAGTPISNRSALLHPAHQAAQLSAAAAQPMPRYSRQDAPRVGRTAAACCKIPKAVGV